MSNIEQRDQAREARVLQQVQEALAAQDISRALEIAREALSGGLVHPMLLNLRAYWLEQQGDDAGALADLAAAVRLAPNDPLINNAHGLQLGKMNRHEEAVAAFRKAVEMDDRFAPAHFNLGWATEAIGDIETSRQCYERAVALNPAFSQAHSHLANLAARRGDWEQAYSQADRALALDRHQNLALRAKAIAAVAQDDFQEAEDLIQHVIGSQSTQPFDRAITEGVLGDLRHAQGRYSEAFAAYTQGNDGQRALSAQRFAAEGIDSATGYLRWLTTQLPQGIADVWAAQPGTKTQHESGGAAAHVFLVGFPRSGTTLLENVLASHPKIAALEEKELFADAVREFMVARTGGTLKPMSDADVARHRDIYWRGARNFGVNAEDKLFLDKHPLNSIKLPLVAKLFPNAKILFALRDPRDVVLSCFRRAFQMNSATFEFLSLEGTARYYDAVMRLSMLYRDTLRLNWRDVRHEALLGDFTGETQSICDFIGVEWLPQMAQFADTKRVRMVATASSAQVRQGLNREGVDQWRNYKEQMAPVLPILQPWVEKFGYPAG